MTHVTSDEINYLVYRYLLESGFTHAAFTFGHESFVNKSAITPSDVPAAQLITLIEKGLRYIELEQHVAEDGAEILCDQPFSVVYPHKCEVKGRRERQVAPDRLLAPSASDNDADFEREPSSSIEVEDREVTELKGHGGEVFVCQWSPNNTQLASGSGDSTARIWTIPQIPSGEKATILSSTPFVLKHRHAIDSSRSNDVTTLDWNIDGSLLATGSYDGNARIWTSEGQIKYTLTKHKGPLFCLRWNKKGDYLLTGSVDKSCAVWDIKTGELKQSFEFHTGARKKKIDDRQAERAARRGGGSPERRAGRSGAEPRLTERAPRRAAPTLDVDWRNNVMFASCSTDKTIHVCKLGDTRPVRTYAAHEDEVNAIRWDATGNLLASCSDDHTAKVWAFKGADKNENKPLFNLQGHTKEIYTISWSPTGPQTANPNQNLILASASFDSTVQLWEMEFGRRLLNFNKHREPVYSIEFSPSGGYIASGSFDHNLHVWSVKDGSIVKTYRGRSGIFELSWSSDGQRIAACFQGGNCAVFDIRM
eukprot:tig00021680_g23046.t1